MYEGSGVCLPKSTQHLFPIFILPFSRVIIHQHQHRRKGGRTAGVVTILPHGWTDEWMSSFSVSYADDGGEERFLFLLLLSSFFFELFSYDILRMVELCVPHVCNLDGCFSMIEIVTEIVMAKRRQCCYSCCTVRYDAKHQKGTEWADSVDEIFKRQNQIKSNQIKTLHFTSLQKQVVSVQIFISHRRLSGSGSGIRFDH